MLTKEIKIVTVGVTTDTVTYASGDALGNKFTIIDAVSRRDGVGKIQSITLSDQADQGASVDIVLFEDDFSESLDNAPVSYPDEDLEKCIGTLTVATTDYKDLGNGRIATIRNLELLFKCTGSKNLYGQLVSRGTPTYASDSLQLKIGIEQG